MSLADLWRRYSQLPADDRGFYRRRFLDLKICKRVSFSQYGEDVNAMEYLRTFGRKRIRYLDIGANDPFVHSNTYLFYREGSSGVVVDANPAICARFRRKRPRDLVINAGICAQGGGAMALHIMDLDGLSSLSPAWAQRLESSGLARQIGSVEISLVGINDLLQSHCAEWVPELASIDIEGMDHVVLEAWDFDRWRPALLVVETGQLQKGRYEKDSALLQLMQSRGYMPLFETYSNTIFRDLRSDAFSSDA